jgi:hypothetical protein
MCKGRDEPKLFNARGFPSILANSVDGGGDAQTLIQVFVGPYYHCADSVEVPVRVAWNEAHVKSFLRIPTVLDRKSSLDQVTLQPQSNSSRTALMHHVLAINCLPESVLFGIRPYRLEEASRSKVLARVDLGAREIRKSV